MIAALALGLASTASALQSDLGGADALFPLLQAPAGARSLSLGGAYGAVVDGAEAAAYNPASVAWATAVQAGFHHDVLLAGITRESLQLSTPVGARGGLAAWATYIRYPELRVTDAQGQAQGRFQPNDLSVGLGGGWQAFEDLSLGLSLRALREELPGSSLRGVSGDLGALARPMPGLQLGLALQLRPLRDVDGDGLGIRTLVAASYALQHEASGAWLGSASLTVHPERAMTLRAGLEKDLSLKPLGLALRAGWSGDFPSASLSNGGPCFGVGLGFAQASLDYAYLPGSLGGNQQLSMTWRSR